MNVGMLPAFVETRTEVPSLPAEAADAGSDQFDVALAVAARGRGAGSGEAADAAPAAPAGHGARRAGQDGGAVLPAAPLASCAAESPARAVAAVVLGCLDGWWADASETPNQPAPDPGAGPGRGEWSADAAWPTAGERRLADDDEGEGVPAGLDLMSLGQLFVESPGLVLPPPASEPLASPLPGPAMHTGTLASDAASDALARLGGVPGGRPGDVGWGAGADGWAALASGIAPFGGDERGPALTVPPVPPQGQGAESVRPDPWPPVPAMTVPDAADDLAQRPQNPGAAAAPPRVAPERRAADVDVRLADAPAVSSPERAPAGVSADELAALANRGAMASGETAGAGKEAAHASRPRREGLGNEHSSSAVGTGARTAWMPAAAALRASTEPDAPVAGESSAPAPASDSLRGSVAASRVITRPPDEAVPADRWHIEPPRATLVAALESALRASSDGSLQTTADGATGGHGDGAGRRAPQQPRADAAAAAALGRAASVMSSDALRVEPSSGTSPGAPAAEPTADGEPLAHAVVRSLRLQWRNGGGEATLRLQPSFLGEMTVSLRIQGSGVTAVLQSESPVVRSWIEAHQAELKRALEAQGLSLDALVVDPDAHPQQRRDQPARDDGQAPGRRRPRPTGSFEALL